MSWISEGVLSGEGTTPLSRAQSRMEMWELALDAVSAGQQYQIGKTMLTRVDLDKCLKMIKFYQGEVSRLTRGGRPGARMLRAVPRDC